MNDDGIQNKNDDLEEVKYVPNGVESNEIKKLQPVRTSDTFLLYYTILIGTLPLFVGSTSLVWLSPVLEILQSNATDVNPLGKPVTTLEVSLLSSLPFLLGLLGSLVLPKTADYMGRKNFLLLTGATMITTYLATSVFNEVTCLISLRCLMAVCLNGSAVITQVYISEICEDHNRTKYMYLKSLTLPIGYLYTYAIGSYLSYRNFNIACGLPILPFLVLFPFVPESPVFFLSKGKIDDCKTALQRLRWNKTPDELEADFRKMATTLEVTKRVSDATFLSLFARKEAIVATKLTVLLFVLEYSSGIAVIPSYVGPLLNGADTGYSERTMTITVGITQVTALFVSSFLVERIRRKVLLSFSCVGSGAALFSFGLFFYFSVNGYDFVRRIQWMPLCCMVVYFLILAVGLVPLPIAIVTELFPPDLATVGLSFGITVMSVTTFLLNFVYPILLDCVGIYWCMWIFSLCCLVGGGLVCLVVPETKGRSQLEIQEMLKNY